EFSIRWIAGHEGIQGNELVDEEARAAASSRRNSSPKASLPLYLRRRKLPRSISALKQDYRKELYARWKEILSESARSRHFQTFHPSLPSSSY
ncbi:hypothetical protein CONPUDRAFT_39462, partial [Coniophora puteana RWD-64-598 SS2]